MEFVQSRLEADFQDIRTIPRRACHGGVCFCGLKKNIPTTFDLYNLCSESSFHMCDIFRLPCKNTIFI